MPLVSVILPTRDRPGLLPRAVESVFAQTGVDWELIVVDNNRHGASLARSDGSWTADPRVRIVPFREGESASSVRNAGLDAARGEWISYLDDDDAYRPGKLEAQLNRARADAGELVLCGACYHLSSRIRTVQCEAREWRGDELILRARWNTPLLFHRHPGDLRFDLSLSPGEDAEFAHRLLARRNLQFVSVVPEPLVDIFPQPGARVNANALPLMRTAAKILALRPGFYSRSARRRYVLQNLLAVAKLARRPGRCLALGALLIRESGGADWRPAANALLVSLGWFPGRWVS